MKNSSKEKGKLNRREFLTASAAVGMATVVPRNVLGKGFIAPSDKITMINVGCGFQGFSDLRTLIACPQIELVGVADPNTQSNDYLGWGPNGLRNMIRTMIDEPTWFEGVTGQPGGRNVMKFAIETYYRKNRGFTGEVRAHEDYRELLATMRDVDTVKITSTDHQHSNQAVHCYRLGKHMIMQKPLGNKLHESMRVVDLALANPRIATYTMAWGSSWNNGINQTKAWIDAGAIGRLREIHNWSSRPHWVQFADIPKQRPPIPRGFNWDLWLGPSLYRQFSPDYTHCNFRGWFEFGAGSIADMGEYSMMPVFNALGLGAATSASSRFSRQYTVDQDNVPRAVVNTWSFPLASAFRFEIPYGREKIFFNWHDGGMKPDVPSGYPADDLALEGMMFVGESGCIVGGFNGQNPRLIGLNDRNMRRFGNITAPAMPNTREEVAPGTPRWLQEWIDDVKGVSTRKNRGSFDYVSKLTETYNIGSISMMRNGRKVEYDPTTRRITNDEVANRLLHRDTRPGWEFV